MRIDFRKNIVGADKLDRFVTVKSAYYDRAINGDVILFDYDLGSIEEFFLRHIKGSLTNEDYTFSSSTRNSLQMTSPHLGSLSLFAMIEHGGPLENMRNDYIGKLLLRCQSLQNIGTRMDTRELGFFRKRSVQVPIPVFREIPCVDLAGRVYFNPPLQEAPLSLLESLESLDYKCLAIPTHYGARLAVPQRSNGGNNKRIKRVIEEAIKDATPGIISGIEARREASAEYWSIT